MYSGLTKLLHYFIFTNGQLHFLKMDYRSFLKKIKQKWFRIKKDFFSNKLWVTLDEPKLYVNLLRFERRFMTAGSLAEVLVHDLKR